MVEKIMQWIRDLIHPPEKIRSEFPMMIVGKWDLCGKNKIQYAAPEGYTENVWAEYMVVCTKDGRHWQWIVKERLPVVRDFELNIRFDSVGPDGEVHGLKIPEGTVQTLLIVKLDKAFSGKWLSKTGYVEIR